MNINTKTLMKALYIDTYDNVINERQIIDG